MTINNNAVSLQQTQTTNMTSQLIYYSVDDIYRLYPTVTARRWTKDDFMTWIDQDIISGNYEENDLESIQIEKESLESFLDYHTQFLKRRVDLIEKGIENLKNVTGSKID